MIILFSVDKRFNANIENIDVCQVNIKGRKGAHKYQDTMGDVSNIFITI